jgi:hypothetical protein
MQRNLSQIFRENLNISEEDLKEAHRIKAEKGGDFGEILVTKKMITERQLLEALSIQYDIPSFSDSFFLNFNANCELRIAMSPEVLGNAGLD